MGHLGSVTAVAAAFVVFGLLLPRCAAGAEAAKSPDSKVYVSEVHGQAVVQIGDRINPLVARQAYPTKDLAIETSRGSSVSLVFSNGTGAVLGANTRIEVKRFAQDPFRPDRSNIEVEPSISHAELSVVRGTATISVSAPVAGSSLTVLTPLGDVNVHSGALVVTAADASTHVSMMTGSCTVTGTDGNSNFQNMQAGDQASLQPAAAGQSNRNTVIEVVKIPPAEVVTLQADVAEASTARKSVYFDVKQSSAVSIAAPGPSLASGSPGAATGNSSSSTGNSTSSTDSASQATGAAPNNPSGESNPSTRVTAFDTNAATNTFTTGATGSATRTEIVPIPTVPSTLPVQYTISPALITSLSAPPVGG